MRNPDYFYEKTAQQLSEDLGLVKKVNKFFWKYGVKEPIRKGTEPVLYVKGLGTIFVSIGKVRKEIVHRIKILRFVLLNEQGKSEQEVEKNSTRVREKIKELLEIRNKLALHLYKVEQRKKQMNEQVVGVS